MREKHSNTDIERKYMRDIVFLGGLLVVLLYAMGMTHKQEEETEPEQKQEEIQNEEWQVVKCEKVEQRGDTIIAIQTLVKIRNNE